MPISENASGFNDAFAFRQAVEKVDGRTSPNIPEFRRISLKMSALKRDDAQATHTQLGIKRLTPMIRAALA